MASPHGQPRPNDEEPFKSLLPEYAQLAESMIEARPDTVGQQLPRLANHIATSPPDEDEFRYYLVGVSFTKNYTLLDYELYRILQTDVDGPTTVELKEPVSDDHHYIRFTYPHDPQFDNRALRSTIISLLHQRMRRLENMNPEENTSGLSEMWRILGDPGSD